MTLTDCYISIDTTDLSGKNTNVAIHSTAGAVDVTTMGFDGWRVQEGGIKEWSMAAEFLADEATVGLLFDKLGEQVAVEVRASATDPRGPTNPGYSGNGILSEFTPIDGAVGDAHKVTLAIVSAGALTRDVTPEA